MALEECTGAKAAPSWLRHPEQQRRLLESQCHLDSLASPRNAVSSIQPITVVSLGAPLVKGVQAIIKLNVIDTTLMLQLQCSNNVCGKNFGILKDDRNSPLIIADNSYGNSAVGSNRLFTLDVAMWNACCGAQCHLNCIDYPYSLLPLCCMAMFGAFMAEWDNLILRNKVLDIISEMVLALHLPCTIIKNTEGFERYPGTVVHSAVCLVMDRDNIPILWHYVFASSATVDSIQIVCAASGFGSEQLFIQDFGHILIVLFEDIFILLVKNQAATCVSSQIQNLLKMLAHQFKFRIHIVVSHCPYFNVLVQREAHNRQWLGWGNWKNGERTYNMNGGITEESAAEEESCNCTTLDGFLSLILPGNYTTRCQISDDIQRLIPSFVVICHASFTVFHQFVPGDSGVSKLAGKTCTSKDAIPVTHSHTGVNKYLLGIIVFTALFGTARADISSDSGVNQALIVFEAALTDAGLAIVAFITILQYTGGFKRRVSPLETLKAFVALSLEWCNNPTVNSINVRHSIQNDETKRSAMEWLQKLKTMIDARPDNAEDYHIELQREPEELWLIKFLMQWAFDIELIMEDALHISKLSGDWSSSEKFKKASASNLDQDHTCLRDLNERLDRITTLMTKKVIFAILQLSIPIYSLEFVNFPNFGNLYGCLNCFHNGTYFRNGTLLSHQQITKLPLSIGDEISIAFGVVVAFSSKLFKHYDCENHRWLRWVYWMDIY
ncbi:hypothetical protein PILCRDRAFT_83527 [Piloderma croceum F 1598]|uniref:Uncharacterized protein n=1 Tax=Piloderma croceum (strain F 1598) TaxID=765440 RepID=A0A0C3G7W7_PILCF|nr:hypothetical protein PILCRDRAFT_83527 [Piloderma croceum F 1598]